MAVEPTATGRSFMAAVPVAGPGPGPGPGAGLVPGQARIGVNASTGSSASRPSVTKVMVRTEHIMRQAIDRLRKLMLLKEPDSREFYQYCLILARTIDESVTYNLVSPAASEIPLLIKQIFKYKGNDRLQPPIMLLMLSVKNACGHGYFRVGETHVLTSLVEEIMNCFNTVGNSLVPEAPNVNHIISPIMSRYYPRLVIKSILTSIEAKIGYGCHVLDFEIVRKPNSEKICLFVVRTDNFNTSACLVNPPQVSFLINGKGVERRHNIVMDPGPQIPTDILGMLKFGLNFLQAVGEFNGNYVIAIMMMTERPSAALASQLSDYVNPATSTYSSDNEIVEGPSKISLSCPISCKRIAMPVKGSMCRHHQCFDYENFMDINSRRPSWRCPYCNGALSFLDLRIDQTLLKVLREVDEAVSDVLIYEDGSWKSTPNNEKNSDDSDEENITDSCNTTSNREHKKVGNREIEVIDLTDESTEGISNEEEGNTPDVKPDIDVLQRIQITGSFLNRGPGNHSMLASSGYNAHGVAEALGRDRVQVSAFNSRSHLSGLSNRLPTPILTDAVTTSLNQIPTDTRDCSEATNSLHIVPSTTLNSAGNHDILQLHAIHDNLNTGSDYERLSSQTINRLPIAIQALPAQTQVATTFRSARSDAFQQNSLSQFSFHGDVERHQVNSRQYQNFQCNNDIAASTLLHMLPQGQNQVNHSINPLTSTQNPIQSVVRNTTELQSLPTSRASIQLSGESQNQQLLNHWKQASAQAQPMSAQFPPLLSSAGQINTASDAPTSTPSLVTRHAQVPHRSMSNTGPSNQFPRSFMATNSNIQLANNLQSIGLSRHGGGDQRQTSSAMLGAGSHTEGLEQAWRPIGRMRGSITVPGNVGMTSGIPYFTSRGLLRPIQPSTAASLQNVNHSTFMHHSGTSTQSRSLTNNAVWSSHHMAATGSGVSELDRMP